MKEDRRNYISWNPYYYKELELIKIQNPSQHDQSTTTETKKIKLKINKSKQLWLLKMKNLIFEEKNPKKEKKEKRLNRMN